MGNDCSLDMLVPTLSTRSLAFRGMLYALQGQIAKLKVEQSVGIRWECDAGELTIGAKRNILVARSQAEFVIFVDDDDIVLPWYLEEILKALGPGDVDCVGVIQDWRLANGMQQPVFISSRYRRKFTLGDPGIGPSSYHIPAQHTCAIRRSIMAAFPFPEINQGEDEQQAIAMADANAITSERMVTRVIYSYVPGWQKRKFGIRHEMPVPPHEGWGDDLGPRERAVDQVALA